MAPQGPLLVKDHGNEQSESNTMKHKINEELSGDENEYIEIIDSYETVDSLETVDSYGETVKFETLKDFENHFRHKPGRKRSSACSFKMVSLFKIEL